MGCGAKVDKLGLLFCRAIYKIVLQICKTNLIHARMAKSAHPENPCSSTR